MELSSSFSDKAKNDLILVEKAKKGDERAFAELLGKYRDSIYYMLLKMVKNHDDAEDLTIEAFGKAFKNIKSYTPTFAFSTWLFKIASNNGIDFIRSSKAANLHISIDDSEDPDVENVSNLNLISDTPTPEEKMISKQKNKLLRTVVKQLHPDYSEIIKLRYFKELSYTEIAEELGLPLGTVKARLYRSRELLSSILEDINMNKDKL